MTILAVLALATRVAAAPAATDRPPTPKPRPAPPRTSTPTPPLPAPADASPRAEGTSRLGADLGPEEWRRRLRICATQWRKLKTDGAAGSAIWREFAPVCFAKAAIVPPPAAARGGDAAN